MEDEVEKINILSLPLHPPWERYGWFKNLLSTSGGQSATKKQLYWYFTSTKTASFFYLWTTMVRTSLCFEHGTLWTRTPTCSPKVPRLRTILYSPPHTQMQTQYTTCIPMYHPLVNHTKLANVWVQLFKVIMQDSWKRSPTVYCIHWKTCFIHK